MLLLNDCFSCDTIFALPMMDQVKQFGLYFGNMLAKKIGGGPRGRVGKVAVFQRS